MGYLASRSGSTSKNFLAAFLDVVQSRWHVARHIAFLPCPYYMCTIWGSKQVLHARLMGFNASLRIIWTYRLLISRPILAQLHWMI